MSENTKENYQQRLNDLNKNAKKKSVWESIDRPIRPLIYQMHRIGLRSRYCCCGFPYDKEEEPKSHSLDTYVQFYTPTKREEVVSFFTLCDVANQCGWRVELTFPGVWTVRYQQPEMMQNYWDKGNFERGIHSYELNLIHINKLTKNLEKIPSKVKEITIIDGNGDIKEKWGIDEWQVEPKQNHFINVEDVENKIVNI